MNDRNSKLLKELMSKVHQKIELLDKEKNEYLTQSNEVNNLLSDINMDEIIFSSDEFVESLKALIINSSIPEEDKKEYIIKVEWLNVVNKVSNVKSFEDYNDEEKKFVTSIKEFLVAQSSRVNLSDGVYTKTNVKLNIAYRILDKLRVAEKGKEHFSQEELFFINDIVSDMTASYKIDVQNLICYLTGCIHHNKLAQMNETLPQYIADENIESEDIDNEVESYFGDETVDLELLRKLFESHSLNFDDLSTKHQKVLAKCKFSRIKDLLEYILANRGHNMFEFLFDAQDHNIIRDKLLFYQILRFSTVDILKHLVNDAKNNDVELRLIFSINGVFKRVSKNQEDAVDVLAGGEAKGDYVSGSFEYYKRNCKLFKNLTQEYMKKGIEVDCLKDALGRLATVLSRSDILIAKNLQIAKDYGLELVKNIGGDYRLNSLSYLVNTNLVEAIVNVIENDFYEYANDNCSVLVSANVTKNLIRKRREHDLTYTSSGKIKGGLAKEHALAQKVKHINGDVVSSYFKNLKLSDQFYANLAKYESNLSLCNINEMIEQLDHELLGGDKKVYRLKNVMISRVKVIEVSNAMQGLAEFEEMSSEDRELFALTYYSYYTEDEFNLIKAYCYSKGKGGNGNGLSF